MATDFKYASQSDLEMYYPAYSQYDAKRQVFGWTTTGTSNLYLARDSGLVTQLFADGEDLGDAEANSGVVNANGEWYYDSALDTVYYFNDASSPADLVMEGGIDNATYFDQMLVNASMKLNNLMDKRYPTPVPKHPQFDANSTGVSAVTEYDAIIIEATCYLCASTLLRTNGSMEEADNFANLVTNLDGSGLVDKLNRGESKLAYEVDAHDSKGKISTISKTGTMDIVEVGGAYVGKPYDLLRITCTTAGAYGTAKIKVEYYGNNQLQGSEKTDIIVTGGLQEIHNGLYVRFQGASMNLSGTPDQWEIDVYSEERKITNASSSGIQLTRRGYGI